MKFLLGMRIYISLERFNQFNIVGEVHPNNLDTKQTKKITSLKSLMNNSIYIRTQTLRTFLYMFNESNKFHFEFQ